MKNKKEIHTVAGRLLALPSLSHSLPAIVFHSKRSRKSVRQFFFSPWSPAAFELIFHSIRFNYTFSSNFRLYSLCLCMHMGSQYGRLCEHIVVAIWLHALSHISLLTCLCFFAMKFVEFFCNGHTHTRCKFNHWGTERISAIDDDIKLSIISRTVDISMINFTHSLVTATAELTLFFTRHRLS